VQNAFNVKKRNIVPEGEEKIKNELKGIKKELFY
jgi:hypothetical protein